MQSLNACERIRLTKGLVVERNSFAKGEFADELALRDRAVADVLDIEIGFVAEPCISLMPGHRAILPQRVKRPMGLLLGQAQLRVG